LRKKKVEKVGVKHRSQAAWTGARPGGPIFIPVHHKKIQTTHRVFGATSSRIATSDSSFRVATWGLISLGVVDNHLWEPEREGAV